MHDVVVDGGVVASRQYLGNFSSSLWSNCFMDEKELKWQDNYRKEM